MKNGDFKKLVENKTENDLSRILNRYANDLIDLTDGQVNKIIKLKNKRSNRNKNDESRFVSRKISK